MERVAVVQRGGISTLPKSWINALVKFMRRRPLGAISLFILVSMGLIAVFAPWIAPKDPASQFSEVVRKYGQSTVGPNREFWFGTDYLARDILSRIIYGSRVSLTVAFAAVALGDGLGGMMGIASGYFGKWIDAITMRIADILMAFPLFILALAIVTALGPSLRNVILAIGVAALPRAARITRSATLSIKEMEYVEAARAIGAGHARILFLHVTPQTFAPWLVVATSSLGAVILVEASLSFLGLGVPPPAPSWGNMMSGQVINTFESNPWELVFPGLALTMTVFAFNLLGDALRDHLDPRLKR